MNGEDNEELERRWSYDGPSCGFVDPRFIQRSRFFRVADDSESESSEGDGEIGADVVGAGHCRR
jgi:hypothetical protein